MKCNTIYTAGYSGMSPDQLESMLKARFYPAPALLVDVRFSPASRNPEWSGSRLKARFGPDYLHVKALGNANYKNGGPIQLVNPEAGLAVLAPFLEHRPVVLLCACKSYVECHRKTAAEYLAKRLGAEVVHLSFAVPAPKVKAPRREATLF